MNTKIENNATKVGSVRQVGRGVWDAVEEHAWKCLWYRLGRLILDRIPVTYWNDGRWHSNHTQTDEDLPGSVYATINWALQDEEESDHTLVSLWP